MKDGKTIFLFMLSFFIIGYFVINAYNEINLQSIATDSGFDVGYSSGGSSGGSGGGHSYTSSSGGGSEEFSIESLLATFIFLGILAGIVYLFTKITEYLEKKHLYYQLSFGCATIFIFFFTFFFMLIFLMAIFLISNLTVRVILGLLMVISWLAYFIFLIRNLWKEFKDNIKVERIVIKSKRVSSKLTEEERKILQSGYQIYLEVQSAWMNFDYDNLRKLVTDELFNMYQLQLSPMELKGQQNIMETFKLIESYLLSSKKENGITTIEMVLKVAFFDYIVNKDKKVIRGKKGRRVIMTYLLTFVSSEKKVEVCPHCGAKLEDGNTVCDYCNTIIKEDHQMRLAKKEALKQEME